LAERRAGPTVIWMMPRATQPVGEMPIPDPIPPGPDPHPPEPEPPIPDPEEGHDVTSG
jgi:hypothetical protein